MKKPKPKKPAPATFNPLVIDLNNCNALFDDDLAEYEMDTEYDVVSDGVRRRKPVFESDC